MNRKVPKTLYARLLVYLNGMNRNLEFVKFLGQQSKRKFGQVLLLRDKHTHKNYILKKAEKAKISARAIDQLRNESNYSFTIPQLPSIAYFEETEDNLSLLLAYKEGIPLDEFWKEIPKKKRLEFTKTLVAQLLVLLDHIHAAEIYHCDIKPSNILINGTVDSFEIHLIDFGLALDKKKLDNRKLIFPLGFAAPELLLNRLHLINHTTDYFAMGIMIYFLWSGKLPLAHANPSVFTNLQLAHPIQSHSSMPKDLNKWIQQLCTKPSWPTAPNLLPAEKVDAYLGQSMQLRSKDSGECLQQLENVKQKRWFW